ncbi:winged helix DNA-binding protein [Lutimaribacter saemankumensis]|uniref:Predicted transcription regulator, contains HTH domain, MarR family n=1 Tax=Lutimaribacter saemankumensis TaxID=490829 RepID=A0A1G8M8E0_9RHOB|nr:winged helix DNA-binding protein [Lutimaribacter saemankumensis]SDI63630.1 Predicted transcription regulator, contains HTH domain, MarR family [Lutimaribacter saemankumensis]
MSPNKPESSVDRRWHLAQEPLEVELTDFEYALMRAFESFGRWQAECLASSARLEASGPENALLHVIRMHDRPKTIKELARLTNRDDIPNIQYSLRKLLKAGLIAREGSSRTGVHYTVTDEGRAITDRYAEIRRELLVSLLGRLKSPDASLRDATRTLELLVGIYDSAALDAVTHRRD